MSKQVQGYVRFAINANALAAARQELMNDKGLPESQWKAAHKEAVSLIAGEYNVEPVQAGRNALEWGCGFTFEGGSAPQKALSRVCGLITGATQKAMREASKASTAFKKLGKGEQVVARVEAAFANLEKIAKKDDLSADARRALVRHAKHLLLLASK